MNDTTRRYPRTSREAFGLSAREAIAIEVYRTPLHKRALLAFCRCGWLMVPAVLAVLVFSGCTSDVQDYAAVQADLADAIHQAAKEAGK